MAIQFPGKAVARERLLHLSSSVGRWSLVHGRRPKIVSFYAYEDEASVLYTKLKQADAHRVGMEYHGVALSLQQSAMMWLRQVRAAATDPAVDGILVQKPSAAVYAQKTGQTPEEFTNWWVPIAEALPLEKDVDGLSPEGLHALERDAQMVREGRVPCMDSLGSRILPATAQAVIDTALIATEGLAHLRRERVAVIGRSAIVGRPVVAGLQVLGVEAEIFSSQHDLSLVLPAFSVIVSATGKAQLVQSAWVREGVILLDVGAPLPEFAAGAAEKSRFWTPVPGGIGPMTRVCLLENMMKIVGE